MSGIAGDEDYKYSLLSRFDGVFLLLFYSIMLRAVLGLFPYLGKDFYVL